MDVDQATEVLYGAPGGRMPEGVITAQGVPLCRLFTANDDAALVGEIYLNGKGVADDCVAAHMATRPGVEAFGWADLLKTEIYNGHPHYVAGDDGQPLSKRHYGVVKWEKSEDDTAGPRDDDLNECVFLDENGAIIATHDCHVVDMEQSDTADRLDDFVEATVRNSEKLQEQLERQADPAFWAGWQYAKLKYCHDAMCLPSELTQAQERQAFLNYTMEYYS